MLVKATTEAGFVGALQQLVAMGIEESFVPEFAPGAATVSGPVTCGPVPGSPAPAGPRVKVLLGTDGTQVFSPDQRIGSPGPGTWHLSGCMVFNPTDTGSGSSGNSGNTGAG